MAKDKKCCGSDVSPEKPSGCCSGSKIAIMLVVIVAVGVGAFAYIYGKKNASEAEQPTKVAAVVEKINENPVLVVLYGEEIKRQDVIDIVNSMPAQMKQIPIEQLFPMALEQLVNNKIIDKNAAESGLDDHEVVVAKLEQAKKQIIRAQFLEDVIASKVTPEAVKARYEEYVANFPDVEEIKAAHILVDDEALAKAIIVKLNKGEAFADLAKENSKDGSAESGGDLGYFAKTDVVPEFAEVAFSTNVGEYTKVPVKSKFGYHIINIEEKRKRPPAEFAQIKTYMEQEMQRKALDDVLKELKVGVEIKRFDINGNPLPEVAPEETSPAAGGGDAQDHGHEHVDAEPAVEAEAPATK